MWTMTVNAIDPCDNPTQLTPPDRAGPVTRTRRNGRAGGPVPGHQAADEAEAGAGAGALSLV